MIKACRINQLTGSRQKIIEQPVYHNSISSRIENKMFKLLISKP